MSDAPLVIGVGNRMRRDDGAGPAVLDALAARGIETVEVNGDCAQLIELWDGRPLVHVVDAMRSNAVAGAVLRLDAAQDSIPCASFPNTSHLIGVAEAAEIARYLGRRPDRLIVWGIEGAAFDHGETMSRAVTAAVGQVADRLAAELAEAGHA